MRRGIRHPHLYSSKKADSNAVPRTVGVIDGSVTSGVSLIGKEHFYVRRLTKGSRKVPQKCHKSCPRVTFFAAYSVAVRPA